jgi:hypothetical protein
MLAEQVWVVSGAEDGALAGGQAWEGGEGGEALGLGEQGRGAEAGFEDLEGGGAFTPCCSAGGRGKELIDDAGAALLAVGEARGGGVLGDAVGDAVDGQFVVDVEAHGHPPQAHRAVE